MSQRFPGKAAETVDWARVKELVTAALALDAGERAAFISAQCGADAVLRGEVESLLDGVLHADGLYEHPTLPVNGTRIESEALTRLSTVLLESILLSLIERRGQLHAAFRGTARYPVRRQIGLGGMGVVYEVEDRTRCQVVALKTLRRWEPRAIVRLKREFRTLAGIAHPNLVSLYDLVADESQCFFTMELIAGVTFVEDARANGERVDADRIRRTLPQLVEGLLALHRHGRLHRDIKPSNVLVEREGRVVILDFGIASHAAGGAEAERALAGTPAYLSPEQCLGHEPREASDWYAVGVTLYHALTGRVPFDGSLAEMVERKTSTEPEAVSACAREVPSDLEAICHGLLCRDPDRRLSGRDVLERLRWPVATRVATETGSAAPFIGRQADLETLEAAFIAMTEGRGASVCVHGPSALAMAAAGRDVRRMRATAAAEARRIAREDMPWSNPIGRLVQAALACQTGDRETAASLLTAAIGSFDATDMQLYAAVARRRLAALVGGDRGEALRRAADHYMVAQEIRNPPAMAQLLAPGFPD